MGKCAIILRGKHFSFQSFVDKSRPKCQFDFEQVSLVGQTNCKLSVLTSAGRNEAKADTTLLSKYSHEIQDVVSPRRSHKARADYPQWFDYLLLWFKILTFLPSRLWGFVSSTVRTQLGSLNLTKPKPRDWFVVLSFMMTQSTTSPYCEK